MFLIHCNDWKCCLLNFVILVFNSILFYYFILCWSRIWFSFTIFHSRSTKTNVNAKCWLLSLNQTNYSFYCVLLYTHPDQIKGTNQIKILILVLPELGFRAIRKDKKKNLTSKLYRNKRWFSQFVHCS